MTLLPHDLPQQIGPYRVEGLLGQGGGGRVLRARGPDGQPVALKLPRLLDHQDRLYFARECRLHQQLGGEGLIPLLDEGESEHGPYAVFPLATGGSLKARLHGGPLPWPEAVDCVRRVAEAAGRMHAAGVVHRDLKPDNVLLSESGQPWITDFGLSKHHDRGRVTDSISLSQTGMLSGSPAFMAPEQALDAKHVGPAADVFSLGALLYTLIAGRAPFGGRSVAEVLDASASGRFRPLRVAAPEVPEWVDEAVRRALAVRPEERPPTGSAFAALLHPAPDVAPAQPAGSLFGWLAAAVVFAALAVGGLVGLLTVGGEAHDAPPTGPVAAEPAAPPPAPEPRPTPPVATQAPTPAPPPPQAERLPPIDPEVLCPGLGGHLGLVGELDVSSDGTLLLTGGFSRELRVFSAETGLQRQGWYDDSWGVIEGVAFGESPRFYALTEGGHVLGLELGSKRVLVLPEVHPGASDLDADAEGRIVSAGADGLRLWAPGDAWGGRVPPLACAEPIAVARFAPEGGGLALGARTLWRWAPGEHPEPALRLPEAREFVDLAWSPDGDRVATFTRDRELTVYTWPGLERLRGRALPVQHPSPIPPEGRGLCFAADGQRIYTVGPDNWVTVWPLSLDEPVGEFEPNHRFSTRVRRLPDGDLAVVGNDGQLVVYSATGYRPRWAPRLEVQQRITGNQRVIARDGLAWLDERTLLLNTIDDVQALDVETGKLLERTDTLQCGRVFCMRGRAAFSLLGETFASAGLVRQGDTLLVRDALRLQLNFVSPTDLVASDDVLYLLGTDPGGSGSALLYLMPVGEQFQGPVELGRLGDRPEFGALLPESPALWALGHERSVSLQREALQLDVELRGRPLYAVELPSRRLFATGDGNWQLLFGPGRGLQGTPQRGLHEACAFGDRFALRFTDWIEVRSSRTGDPLLLLRLPLDDVPICMLPAPSDDALYVWTYRGDVLRYRLPGG